jgi:hypothetical protein
MSVGKAVSQAATVRTIAAELAKPSPLEQLAKQVKAGTVEGQSVALETMRIGDVLDSIDRSPFKGFIMASASPEERAGLETMRAAGQQIKALLGDVELPQMLEAMKNDPLAKALVGQLDAVLEAQMQQEVRKTFSGAIPKAEQKLATRDYRIDARALAADLGVKLSEKNIGVVANLVKEEAKKTLAVYRELDASASGLTAGSILHAMFSEIADSLAKLGRVKAAIHQEAT